MNLTVAIARALIWLRENPEKHITGSLAVTKEGLGCAPNDPEAECFCVLGRISHELDTDNYPIYASDEIAAQFRAVGLSDNHEVYNVNDQPIRDNDGRRLKSACGISRSNQKVIPFLAARFGIDLDAKPAPAPALWRRIKNLIGGC